MKPPPDEEFWTLFKQERRRVYWIFVVIAAFGIAMPFWESVRGDGLFSFGYRPSSLS